MLEEATKSENKESYKLVERNKGYRIGVGVELAPSGQPLFFIEIVVNLCTDSSRAVLPILERSLAFLKDLEAKGYSISCQDGNFISCQKPVKSSDLKTEYEAIRSIAPRTANRETAY